MPITYDPLMVSYTGQRNGEASNLTFMLAGNFGFSGLGSSRTEFDNLRYKAKDNYAYVRSDLSYTRALGGDFALAVRGSAQLSDSPLVSSEQFAAGGASSVRGYLEAEDTGDNGAVASVELRSPSVLPSSLFRRSCPFLRSWRAISVVIIASIRPSGISFPSASRMAGVVMRWPTLRTSRSARPFSRKVPPSGRVKARSGLSRRTKVLSPLATSVARSPFMRRVLFQRPSSFSVREKTRH